MDSKNDEITTLKNKVDLKELIECYGPSGISFKKTGKSSNNYKALCPFHSEKTPSFSVNTAKQSYYCFGCGEKGDAFDFLENYKGMSKKESIEFIKKNYSSLPVAKKEEININIDSIRASKNYPKIKSGDLVRIKNSDGEINSFVAHSAYEYEGQGYVLRLFNSQGKKWTPMVRFIDGEWTYQSFNEPRPLYGLESDNLPVLVVEGEKAADAGRKVLNGIYDVVTWSGGVNAVEKTDWSRLEGRDVTLLPDNDEQGYRAMEYLNGVIPGSNLCSVPNDLPEKWDIADKEWSGADELKAFIDTNKTNKNNVVRMDGEAFEGKEKANPLGLQSLDEIITNRKPIRWLIKNWLQRKALVMVHGPSGAGKSYAVLDWCMRIANEGFDEWAGHKVRHGNVVYLAGEGNEGLGIRAQAWQEKFKLSNDPSKIWISSRGCSLNTPDGQKEVIESIEESEIKPDVIVVDTLHRFLDGDENSAKDARTMINSCDAMKEYYGCTVILVHHTGASQDAQHRARGSTAWRGALDGEISINPLEGGKIELIQRKNKEIGRPVDDVMMEFESVDIPGFFDEDDEQVQGSILNICDEETVKAAKSNKRNVDKKLVENKETLFQFAKKCADNEEGEYFINTGALRNWMFEHGPCGSANAARQACKPKGGGFVSNLIRHGVLELLPPENNKGDFRIIDQDLILKLNII